MADMAPSKTNSPGNPNAAGRNKAAGAGNAASPSTDPGTTGGGKAGASASSRTNRELVLKVSNLTKRYGPSVILENFSLNVMAGEAVALVGRNGAGKSTLLRCIVGADRPNEGTVEVCGVRMSETKPEIRRMVATVIDDLDFFPDLSVVEHLDLLARAHGLDDADALVDEVLEEVQLVPQSGQLPATLSSGQRRRLALATAFVRPRKLLVLDEPEQRLDVEGLEWLGKRLRFEKEQGLAIVMASHEPSLVEAVGCRVVEMKGLTS